MAAEIERKFLVVSDDWRETVDSTVDYRQGYLCAGPPTTLRARIGAGRARLNIKTGATGIRRDEYEYEIPVQDAHDMLDRHCVGSVIEKTRHFVTAGIHTWEIDVFTGDNAGLVVAEIELSDEAETFARPGWLGPEVTGDPRYYNAALARHPYCKWQNRG